MNTLETILKVKAYTSKERTARLCELAVTIDVMEENLGFTMPEDILEYGIIQGIRLQNGEIDKVLAQKETPEKT